MLGAKPRPFAGLIPLCDMGDAIFSLAHGTTGSVVTHDARGRLWDLQIALTEWMEKWAAGERLWDLMFELDAVPFTNPFTGMVQTRPAIVEVRGKPIR